MAERDLEKKIKDLTRQLEKEKSDKKELERQLEEKGPLALAVRQFAGLATRLANFAKDWANKYFQTAPRARIVTDQAQSPAIETTKTVVEESVSDDIATYRRKLSGYDRHQLEDIYLHIEREAHPERFAAVLEELRRRLASPSPR